MGCVAIFSKPSNPHAHGNFADVTYDTSSNDNGTSQESMVTVFNIAGEVLATVQPVPLSIVELKIAIEKSSGIRKREQRLVQEAAILKDSQRLHQKSFTVTLIKQVDDTPFFAWDIEGNPCSQMLEGEEGIVKASSNMTCDYVNVITKQPLSTGIHYFQFTMRKIGDEQWCGLITSRNQAGRQVSGRSLKGVFYYCGRMSSSAGNLRDGKAALHINGNPQMQFKKPRGSGGDVLGMLVDLDQQKVAFDFNGTYQGDCEIPKQPLHVLTHLDRPGDRVELSKLDPDDAPTQSRDIILGNKQAAQ